MNRREVTIVRIYLHEGQHQFQRLMELLHDQEQMAGVTAFRGIAGFHTLEEADGVQHLASIAGGDIGALADMRANGNEDGVKIAFSLLH